MNGLYKPVELPEINQTCGTGWIPPQPDLRDYTEKTPEILKMANMLKVGPAKKALGLPAKVDLRPWCSPIENQGQLGSCTAHAAMGIVEYFQRRAFGAHIDGSRLFVYKTTRNLMGVVGDTGAWLRNTMGALALCGVPPERYWPYTDSKPEFDKEPNAFVYAVADNYEALYYFCHDPLGCNTPPKTVLGTVKKFLAARVPSMFGFFGLPSFGSAGKKEDIPFPCAGEQAIWGHAVAAVGYDDARKITNTECKKDTKGALLIRNSWSSGWGDQGYGWLPYDYVLSGLALDFWSLLSMDWVNTKKFGLKKS